MRRYEKFLVNFTKALSVLAARKGRLNVETQREEVARSG